MSIVVNEVRRGAYFDSVALMRIAQSIKAIAGIEECGLMMGTPANRRILEDAAVLAAEGKVAGAGDLVIAIRARDEAAARLALAEARRLIDRPRAAAAGGSADWAPRTIGAAVGRLAGANLALVSVPGSFAAVEAMKAMRQGLNVMMFSDNVSLDDEIALKREARARGVLMMGPDCGTAILGGVPLAFANVVARGDIGIVGASGTGIQEVSSLISNEGGGISHAIGTGGRDLKAAVGGITTLMAIDLLDADPATRHIIIISKPPDGAVSRAVLDRVSRSRKRFTVCFVGGVEGELPANATSAITLEAAAFAALDRDAPAAPSWTAGSCPSGRIRGLFAGGTLCAEAQVVLRQAGFQVASNAPIAGVAALPSGADGHTLIDLGDDAYTVGRPHPMIEPAVRDAPLDAALADPTCSVVLLDCVLGYGSHSDPAGHLAARLRQRGAKSPAIVASVTGTEADPQRLSVQVRKLQDAGIRVAPSNAAATRMAVAIAAGSS
jgi:FdrA protein